MKSNIRQLILVPALISLAVTALRLAGELMGGPRSLFNPEPGGGGSLVGISWLVPVFGIYFAVRLIRGGDGPASAGRVLLFAIISIAATLGAGAGLALLVGEDFFRLSVVSLVLTAVALGVVIRVWPALFRTLLAYAVAVRLPVAMLMFFAIRGNWGTHYDVPPSPDFPAMDWVVRWFYIGLVPQMTVWIAFTVVVGMLFGGIAATFTKPKQAS